MTSAFPRRETRIGSGGLQRHRARALQAALAVLQGSPPAHIVTSFHGPSASTIPNPVGRWASFFQKPDSGSREVVGLQRLTTWSADCFTTGEVVSGSRVSS